jgi:hypothetical protein
MGWDFEITPSPISDVIQERVSPQESLQDPTKPIKGVVCDKITWTYLKHSFRLQRLWKVIEKRYELGGNVVQTERFIGLDLLRSEHKCWGYKALTEFDGPCYYDCPLTFLDLASPAPNTQNSIEWRQKVRDHYEQLKARREMKRQAKPGSRLLLTNGWEVTVHCIGAKQRLVVYYGNKLYHVPPRMIQAIL